MSSIPKLGDSSLLEDAKVGDYIYNQKKWNEITRLYKTFGAREMSGKWHIFLVGEKGCLLTRDTTVFLIKKDVNKFSHVQDKLRIKEKIITRFLENYADEDYLYKPPHGIMMKKSWRSISNRKGSENVTFY